MLDSPDPEESPEPLDFPVPPERKETVVRMVWTPLACPELRVWLEPPDEMERRVTLVCLDVMEAPVSEEPPEPPVPVE